jgi:hypothetical protein
MGNGRRSGTLVPLASLDFRFCVVFVPGERLARGRADVDRDSSLALLPVKREVKGGSRKLTTPRTKVAI